MSTAARSAICAVCEPSVPAMIDANMAAHVRAGGPRPGTQASLVMAMIDAGQHEHARSATWVQNQ